LIPGLTGDEARRRLAAVGANEIRRAPRLSRLKMLLRQLASPLIWLLLAAAAISAALARWPTQSPLPC
jgi:Ca2+-transporting ATPase